MVLTGDNARLQILRDTILDNHGQLPYATEGGDMTQAPTDFHAHFVPNEKTDFTISCPDGPRGYPGKIYDAVCTIESFGGFSDVIDSTCAPTTDNTRHSQPLTCNFDPASVPATKDFFTTANLKVNIPAQKPSAQYILTVTATAHNQKIQHTTTVTLTCGLCLPPTERIPFEPLHVSDKGYQFTKDKEAFNLAPRAHITKDCSATVTKNCHVTHDRYGLYQDNGDKTHPTGFCTRGIGINAPYGKRACNQKDIDNYNKQYPGGETRQQAEAEQHKYEDGYEPK